MKDSSKRLEEVKKFSDEALKRYPKLIKSIVLVGSVARGDFKDSSDTDVLVIIDESRQQESFSQIHEELLVIARKFSKKIYVIGPLLSATQFVQNAEGCNPYIYTMLKEGVAIYDRDFFVPFQERFLNTSKYVSLSYLLNSLSKESENLRGIERDLRHFLRVRPIEYIDCMFSSTQFLLMGMGIEPPRPTKIYDAMEKHLVKPGFLERKYANWLKRMVTGIKRIEHYPMRYSTKCVSKSLKRINMVKKFVREMHRLFTIHAKPDVLILMPDGGEKGDRKFPKDKSLSISKNIMRELADKLYLTRREFLKGLVTVGAVAGTAGLSGCLEYIKPKTPKPTVKKRFTPELRIQSYDEFRKWMDKEPWNKEHAGLMELYNSPEKYEGAVKNIQNMLSVLREYSPEWYEKTMYAGEVVEVSDVNAASYYGDISLSTGTVQSGGSRDIKEVLRAGGSMAHEIDHVISLNVYFKKPPEKLDGVETVELELRGGIAEWNDYKVKISFVSEIEAYEFRVKRFKEDIAKYVDDPIAQKNRLDAIDSMYFDHANKRVKTDFLNESWEEFKKLL